MIPIIDEERLIRASQLVLSGQYDALEIHCYNEDEKLQFQAFMDRRFPTVPVKWYWLTFKSLTRAQL